MQARIDELLQERRSQSPSAVLSLEAELVHTRSALAQVTAPFPWCPEKSVIMCLQ